MRYEASSNRDNAFDKAFQILIYKIVENADRSVLAEISINEIKSLIENFSITDEKFQNNKSSKLPKSRYLKR